MTRSLLATLVFLITLPLLGQQQPLTLERAVELALSRNDRIAAEAGRIEAAEARVSQARSFFFPDVTVNGNYTRRQYETVRRIGDEDVTIQSKNALSATANVNSALFNARAFPLYRQAKFERENVRLTAEDQKLRLAFETADAFVITLGNEQVLRAAERRRQFARATLNDTRARFEAGLVSSNDITKAELEVASAEREVLRSNGTVETARFELANLLNTPVQGPLVAPEELMTVATRSPQLAAPLLAGALEDRFDLASQRFRIRALREFAREPALRILPTLGFAGQFRTTNEGGISGRPNDGFVGLNLSWSLFDGGEWLADRAERRALVRIAQSELRTAERRAELEVESAAIALRTDQQSIEQAVRASELARRNAEETAELYRQGLATALEVADANARYFDAEVQEARARYDLLQSYFELRHARGLGPV